MINLCILGLEKLLKIWTVTDSRKVVKEEAMANDESEGVMMKDP